MRVAAIAAAVLAGSLALAADSQTSGGTSSGSSGASSPGSWQDRPTSMSGSGQSQQSHFTQDQYGPYDRRYNWKTSDQAFDSWAKDVQSSGGSRQEGQQSKGGSQS